MAFEALQAELDLDAKGFTRGMDDAQKSMQSLDKQADQMRKTMGVAGLAMTGIAAGGFAAATKAAADFDASLQESVAIMGDVSESMRGQMSDAAREVAKTTTFSASEAADSYFYLASAGLTAEESIAALPQVAQFAQAGMFDMATATDLLTDAASALGLELEDYNSLADTLVKANTLANATVEQFSTALTSGAAPAMKNVNMATEEGVAILAAWADQGIKGEKAGTLFRSTLTQLQSAAINNKDAFDQFGVQVFDAQGNMRNMADIVGDLEGAFSGMSAEQKSAALAQMGFTMETQQGILALMGSSDAIREYQSELSNAGGIAAEVADKQLQTFNAQLDLLKSQFTDIGISIGQVILPHLVALVQRVGVAVEWFSKFNDATGGLAGVLALAATAVGGLLTALVAFSPQIIGVATILKGTLIPAFLGVLGPVALIGAAVAGLALIWTKNIGDIQGKTAAFADHIRSVLDRVSQWLSGFGDVFSSIMEGDFLRALTTAQDIFTAGFQGMKDYLVSEAGPAIAQGVRSLVDGVVEAFGYLETTVVPTVAKAFDAITLWLSVNAVPILYGAFKELASVAAAGLEFLTTTLIPAVANAIQAAMNWILTTGIPLAISAIGALATTITNTLSTLIDILPPVVADAWDALYAWITGPGIPMIGGAFRTVVDHIGTVVGMLVEHLPPLVASAVTGLVAWVQANGIPLIVKVFNAAVTNALAVWEVFQRDIVPLIRAGIDALVAWVTGPGVALAKQAFIALVGTAGAAFTWLKENIPTFVREAVTAFVTWVRGDGTTQAKGAFQTLVESARAAFDWLRTNIPALIKAGIDALVAWVTSTGIPATKQAFQNLVTAGAELIDTLKTELPAKIEAGVRAMAAWVIANGPGLIRGAFEAIGTGIRETLIALFNAGGTVIGLVRDGIGFLVAYLKNDAWSDMKAAAEFMFDAAVTAVTLYFAAQGKVYQLLKAGIGYLITYLKNDAWGDLKAAGEFLFDAMITAGEIYLSARGKVVELMKTAVGAIVTYLMNDAWSDLKAAAEFLFDVIMGAAEGLYDGLIGKSLIPDLFQDIAAYIASTATTLVRNAIQAYVDAVTTIFKLWYDNTVGRFVTFFGNLLGELSGFTKTFIADTKTFLTNVYESFQTRFTNTKDEVARLVDNMRVVVSNTLTALYNFATGWLGDTYDAFRTRFTNTKDEVARLTDNMRIVVSNTLTGLYNFITGWLTDTYRSFQTRFTKTKDEVARIVDNLRVRVTNIVTTLLNDIKRKADNWVSKFTQPFKNAKEKVLTQFANLKKRLVGNSIVPDMLDEMVTKSDRWVNPFLGPFKTAKQNAIAEFNTLKEKLTGIKSKIAKAVKDTGGLVAQGAAKAGKAAGRVSANVRAAVSKAMGGTWYLNSGELSVSKIRSLLGRGVLKSDPHPYDSSKLNNVRTPTLSAAMKAGLAPNRATMDRLMAKYTKQYGGDTRKALSEYINTHTPFEMARGGIVTSAMHAIVGEGSEPEAVTPISKLEEFVNREPAQGEGDTTVNVRQIDINVDGSDEMDEQEVADRVFENLRAEISRLGGDAEI